MNETILQTPRKGRYENLSFRVGSQVFGQTTEEDAGVGSDGGFRVGLHLCEETEQVVVEEAVGELGQIKRRKGRTKEMMSLG